MGPVLENAASASGYEERFDPVGRFLRRLARRIAWPAKGLLGMRRTILIEMRWRLGDEIMALPIYAALRERYPNSRIAVLTNHPDLFRDNAAVDEINPVRPRPDRFILLRSAPRDRYRLEHYAALAQIDAPAARPRVYADAWRSPATARLPRRETPLVALAPGASWPTKRMPAAKWRALADELMRRGHRVVELGNAGEAVGMGTCLAGETSVYDAAAVLREASALVCGDSGLMHLALAVGTPVVALFGPTDPAILVRDEPLLRVVTNNRECRGCWNASQQMREPGVCPLGIDACLDTVSIDDVLAGIAGIERRRSA